MRSRLEVIFLVNLQKATRQFRGLIQRRREMMGNKIIFQSVLLLITVAKLIQHLVLVRMDLFVWEMIS